MEERLLPAGGRQRKCGMKKVEREKKKKQCHLFTQEFSESETLRWFLTMTET